ncbi:MAG TPA: hypothetical protein VK636_08935, partial [Gemmatimonadaceae bacterium]|nr:hypothetical protein [Gemmatimonadaceae bacterium]
SNDRFFYSYGVQAARRVADARSLVNADEDLLRHAGVASDSIARLLEILRAAHVPATVAGVPSSLTTDNASILLRFDRSPYDWKALAASKSTEALTFLGSWTRARPLSLSPTVTPARTGERTNGLIGAQALYSTFIGNDYLTTTRSGVSLTNATTSPYVDLPSASVLVASNFIDGSEAFSTLQFGGNGTANGTSRRWTWETMHETQFYAQQRRSLHRVKVSADARLDGYNDDLTSNQRGSFYFNSLADLSANRPASFTRTLESPTRNGAEWNAYAAVGDLWRISPSLQLQYGARLEGNRFVGTPAYDAAVDQTFGVRNDVAPTTAHVSPRLGFTWIRRGAGNAGAITFNPMGLFNMGPTSYLRGGVGEFRTMLPATLLSDARVRTGLPGSGSSVTCVGSAAPMPNWEAYLNDASSVPEVCTSEAGQLAETSPSVRLFDRGYSAPRSWRGNLSYSSGYEHLTYSIDGTYSYNIDQPSIVDLNLTRTTAFLSTSDGRPMFVAPSAIDAQTGAVSRAASRVSPAFDQVLESRSDARSVSRQVIVTVSPDLFQVSNWLISGSYVLANSRSRENGFVATTAGSPAGSEWMRGPLDARHSFIVQGGYSAHGLTASAFAHFSSGLPFTPIVGSDVNGDGFVNDRAFVFGPATTADQRLSDATRALLAASSRGVRDCLQHQFDHTAAARSCEGPWTSSMTAAITASSEFLHVSKRIRSIQLVLSNPLAGMDLLLHGTNGLHGWGVQPVPDPILYNVRAFDPATRAFSYAVNPRFGNTNPAFNTIRAPFRATIDIQFSIGPDVAIQQLERYLRPGRAGHPGPRLTVDELKRRYERNVPDPYAGIIQESDSLLLTPEQLRAVQATQARYRTRMDSLWFALANDFDKLGDHFDVAAAVKRQENAIDDGFEIGRLDIHANLPRLLTPVQLTVLPGQAARFYRATGPIRRDGRTLFP